MDLNKNKDQIYIKTIYEGKDGKKILVMPEGGKPKQHTTWLWVLFAVFMTISATSFLVDNSQVLVTRYSLASIFEVLTPVSKVAKISKPEPEQIENRDKKGSNKDNGLFYFKSGEYGLPRTSSLAYFVGDVDSGDTLLVKNENMVLPTASLAKLVTAVTAYELMDRAKPLTVSRSSTDQYGSMGGFNVGEKTTAQDLLYPLLMESSNDAAEVLASAYGNDAFVKKMNEKSSKLSMSNTLFVDASGLSPLNVSTTKDLFTLISYINLNRLEIWDITKTKEYSILTHKWTNTNSLARRKSYVGGRNGYTEDADNTSASIFEINIDNQKRKIAIILLKSSDRNADVDAIIRFLENNVGINNTENTEKDGTLLNK